MESVIYFISLCIIFGLFFYGIYRGPTQNYNEIIKQHITTLAVKREQKLKRDDYGNINTKAWEKEKRYFVIEVLKISNKSSNYHKVYDSIDLEINKWIDEQDALGIQSSYIIGAEHFEKKSRDKVQIKGVN